MPSFRLAAALAALSLAAACSDGDGLLPRGPSGPAPVASAGPDRSVAKNASVTLDGSASYHPEGRPLSFSWSLVARPGGSAAALQDAGAPVATFTTDVAGAYVARLQVSDGTSVATDDVTITAVNHPPVANAGPDLEANVGGDALALSAAASSDPDQDPLTCAWSLVSRPEGSAAALSDPASCAPSLAFDLEGTYTASLVVSDGALESAADTVALTVHRRIWMLGHLVVDAEYSKALDRIVTVATGPNRLYVADPVGETATHVDLPLAPTSVSVSPDGFHAAVGHDAYVSHVRLSPAPVEVVKIISTTTHASDVVLAGNGWIYAFPKTDQWETIRCLRIADGVETLSTGYSIRAGTKAKLHPGGAAIYGADNGLSPSDIEKYAISSGTAAYLYDSPYHGDYSMCGDLWITEDGLRIVTACGNTFHANGTQGSTAGSDMTYAGALEGLSNVRWAAHSLAAKEILAVPGVPYYGGADADTELQVFRDDYLAKIETVPLPRVGVGGRGYKSRGRFAFHSADGTRRHALVAVDPAAGLLLPHAVVAY